MVLMNICSLWYTIIVLFLSLFLYRKIKNKRYNQLMSKIPCPPKVPVLGHISLCREEISKAKGENGTTSEAFFSYITRFSIWAQQGSNASGLNHDPSRNDGSGNGIVAMNMGPIAGDYVVIMDPDMYRDVLTDTTNIQKTIVYYLTKDWLGSDNLLMADGDIWRSARKLTTPSFHMKVLESFLVDMNKNADIFVERCQRESITDDVYKIISHFVMRSLVETSFGINITDENEHLVDEYLHNFDEYNECFADRMNNMLFLFEFISIYFSETGRRRSEAVKRLHEFTERAVRERMEYLDTQGAAYDDDDLVEIKMQRRRRNKKCCLADALIQEHRADPDKYSFDFIRHQLDTFAFAGHDTTSCTLRNILLLVATHPRVQQKIHEEMNTLTDDEVNHITSDVMSRIPYLDAVIKEGMRMMPVASTLGRQLLTDAKIGDYIVPKGCNVLFHLYQLHRDSRQFNNPNDFYPERFLPDSEENKKRHPFAFIPFSGGLRNCIGQRFALYELKIFLIKTFKTFQVSTMTKMNDIKMSQGLTLTITNKIDMVFKDRRNN